MKHSIVLLLALAVMAGSVTLQTPAVQSPVQSPTKQKPVVQSPAKKDAKKTPVTQKPVDAKKKPGAGAKQTTAKKGGDGKMSDGAKSSVKQGSPKDAKTKSTKTKAGDAETTGIKTKQVEDKGDEEIPAGTDPEDIRAIRGSQAMRDIEKKLEKVLAKMKIEGKTKFLPFDVLDNWPYEDGFDGMPKRIRKWDKERVVMAGFMLPIDSVEDIKEFYLVKSLWSCCFGTPPDVNGLIKVRIKGKKGLDYQYDPILIVGKFRLDKDMDDDYCVAIYQLDAESVKVIDVDALR